MPSAKPSEHCYALGYYCNMSLLREQAPLTFECQRNGEINTFLLLTSIAAIISDWLLR